MTMIVTVGQCSPVHHHVNRVILLQGLPAR